MLLAMVCWKTMGPAIYVDITYYHLTKHCCTLCTSLNGNMKMGNYIPPDMRKYITHQIYSSICLSVSFPGD